MRSLFSNNLILVVVAAFIGGSGLTLAFCAHDFTWFARCGSLITFIGIIVLSRPSITGKDILLPVVMADSHLTDTDPEYYLSRHEPVPDWVVEDQKSRRAVGILGPLLTLVGTVIWGFADLLNVVARYRR